MRICVRSLSLLAVVSLSASTLRAEEAAKPAEKKGARPNSVAVMDTVVQGAADTLAALMTQTLGSYAANTLGLDVISKDDVRKLISFEAQRQLLGCDADSCGQAAEIGSALGVEKLVTSTLGRIGDHFQLTVVAMDVASSKVVGRATREVRSEDEIVENARDLIHYVLKQEERESKGYLRVTVPMTNARILVDGQEAGRSPMQPLRVLGGKHRVFVEKEGYIPMEAAVDVTPGKETLVDARLVPKKDIKVAGSGYLPWAWATLGVAVVGGAFSTYAYLHARDIYNNQYMADAVTQSQLSSAKDSVNTWGNTLHFYSAIGSGVIGGVSVVLFSAYFLSGLGAGGDAPPALPVEPTPDGLRVRF